MGRIKPQNEWETDFRELIDLIQEYPLNQDYRSALWHQMTGWYNTLVVTAQVPGNEKLPWTVSELGMPIEPMPLKIESGFNHVGDYNIRIRGDDIDMIGGLVGERKSLDDLYGTIMHSDQSQRLHREIDRFHSDSRFDTFIIFAECTNQEFMEYRNIGRYNTDLTNSKLGKCASLFLDSAPIWWCGSREKAALQFKFSAKQWVIKNWEKIIGDD